MNDLFPRREKDQSTDAEQTESGTIGSSMVGSSTHISNETDPGVLMVGDEDTDMKEAAADTSNVETDESSSSDASSPVPMDIDHNTSIDSIEPPVSLIPSKSTSIETFTTPIVTEPIDTNETGNSSKIKPKNFLLHRNSNKDFLIIKRVSLPISRKNRFKEMKRKQLFFPDPMNILTNTKYSRITSHKLVINSSPIPPQIEANDQ